MHAESMADARREHGGCTQMADARRERSADGRVRGGRVLRHALLLRDAARISSRLVRHLLRCCSCLASALMRHAASRGVSSLARSSIRGALLRHAALLRQVRCSVTFDRPEHLLAALRHLVLLAPPAPPDAPPDYHGPHPLRVARVKNGFAARPGGSGGRGYRDIKVGQRVPWRRRSGFLAAGWLGFLAAGWLGFLGS